MPLFLNWYTTSVNFLQVFNRVFLRVSLSTIKKYQPSERLIQRDWRQTYMFKREWYKWVEQCQTHLQFPAAIYDKYSGHFLYTPGDSYLSTLLTVKKKNIGIVLNKLPEEKNYECEIRWFQGHTTKRVYGRRMYGLLNRSTSFVRLHCRCGCISVYLFSLNSIMEDTFSGPDTILLYW